LDAPHRPLRPAAWHATTAPRPLQAQAAAGHIRRAQFYAEVVGATSSEGFLFIYVINGITFQRMQDVPKTDPCRFFLQHAIRNR